MSIHAVGSAKVHVDDRRNTRPRGTAPTVGRCLKGCEFRDQAPWHHDQLLAAAGSVESAVDLLDLAVTWGELDYSGQELIDPSQWRQFLAAHRWPDRTLAGRLFGLAEDVALRCAYATERFSAACI